MFLRTAKGGVRRVLQRLGYALVPQTRAADTLPADIDDATKQLYREVQPYTMSGIEQVAALCQAVDYISRSGVPGDIIECGVWRGGSMMAIARALLRNGVSNRQLHLFDTFEGMPPPTAADVNLRGEDARVLLQRDEDAKATANIWAYAPLSSVQSLLAQTGYDPQMIHYVQGRVEETLPAHAPSQIALLRLDTDWYESTYHELVHLYPRLAIGGVLILDDYGHWQGARRAVDQYIAEHKLRILLNRIDYTSRICVKVDA